MSNPTTSRSQRSREPRWSTTPVCCSECGTFHQSRCCPECGQQPPGSTVAVLHTEITTLAGDRWAVQAERDDQSGGWTPVGLIRLSDDDTGTPWGA